MKIAFGNQQAVTKDSTERPSDCWRFDELIALVHEHLSDSLWAGKKHAFGVEKVMIFDQTIVGHLGDPFTLRLAAGLIQNARKLAEENIAPL